MSSQNPSKKPQTLSIDHTLLIKHWIRIAAVLYLILAISGGYAFFSMTESILVPDNPNKTVRNIIENNSIYMTSIVCNLITHIIQAVLPVALYKILVASDSLNATLMAILGIVSVPISFLNVLFQYLPWILLNSVWINVFSNEQSAALCFLFLELHTFGTHLVQFFWGLWLLPMGIAVYKTGFIPKFIGVFLGIACFVYIFGSIIALFFPVYIANYEIAFLFCAAAEFSFISWLVFKSF